MSVDKITEAINQYKEEMTKNLNEQLIEAMNEARYEAEQSFKEEYDDLIRGNDIEPEKAAFEAFSKALTSYYQEIIKKINVSAAEPKFDRKAYQRNYMRSYRANKKNDITRVDDNVREITIEPGKPVDRTGGKQ